MDILTKLEKACTNSYSVDYECQSNRNCNYGDGACDTICRCSTIGSTRMDLVNISSICRKVLSGIKDPILYYCLERLLFRSELLRPSNWEVNIVGGYYGEETNGADLDRTVLKDVKSKISKLMSWKSPRKMVEYVLIDEYGHLLSRIQKKKWIFKNVKYSDIIIPNEDHYTKLDKDTLARYDDEWFDLKGPRLLCLESSGSERIMSLIDGYHRYRACSKKKNIGIILAT